MSTVNLDNIIISYDICAGKNINQLTMYDTISLVIHMVKRFADGSSDIAGPMKNYYNEYVNQIKEQNNKGWPKIISLRNDTHKRIDGVIGKSHNNTNNLLVLLIKLIHLECEKETPRNGAIKKILDYNISDTKTESIKTMTVADLLDLLKRYMQYYVSIYCDQTRFENVLGNKIINQI